NEQPKPTDVAFAEVEQRITRPETFGKQTPWFRRIFIMTAKQKWQQAVVGGVLGLFIAFFALTQTGQALASDFLGLFRVQKFAPISISPEQLANLENLDLEGLFPGEVVWTQEPVQPQEVATINEAISLAPNAFSFTPDLGEPNEIAVGGHGSGQMTIDLAAARAILNIAGVDGNLLPDSLDGSDISVAVEDGIFMKWDEGDTTFVQMPSPEISYPSDFDPQPVGQAVLQLLGMSEDEAARLSNSIDWSNTLLLPIPTDVASFQEVSINGSTGILVTANDGGESSLIWESAGNVHMLAGDWSADELIDLANG
ncbi:MAG: DUF4367 domain-containing protein, partial [Anaerolineae bacterium]